MGLHFPVNGVCADPTMVDKWNTALLWGTPNVLCYVAILSFALTIVNVAYKLNAMAKMKAMPRYVWPGMTFVAFCILIHRALGCAAMVISYIRFCQAALDDHEDAWVASNALFVSTMFCELFVAWCVLQSSMTAIVGHIISAVLLIAVYIGTIVAVFISGNNLAGGLYTGYAVIGAIVIITVVYIANSTSTGKAFRDIQGMAWANATIDALRVTSADNKAKIRDLLNNDTSSANDSSSGSLRSRGGSSGLDNL